jgi:hypothetical protein
MKVVAVTPLSGSRLDIVFADGKTAQISLAGRLFGPVFSPLADEELFRKAFVDEFGAVSWPNGADLAPDALYTVATASEAPAAR